MSDDSKELRPEQFAGMAEKFAKAAKDIEAATSAADVEGHSVDEAEGEQNLTILNYSCA